LISGGLARVAVRSTGEKGDAKVLVTGKGLKFGELMLRTEYFDND
jgi:hypothetical protein